MTEEFLKWFDAEWAEFLDKSFTDKITAKAWSLKAWKRFVALSATDPVAWIDPQNLESLLRDNEGALRYLTKHPQESDIALYLAVPTPSTPAPVAIEKCRDALDESNGLLVAILHERRDPDEILQQVADNRAAIQFAAPKCPYPRQLGNGLTQDCEWPVCGCDPHADKVIAALQESGILRDTTPPTRPDGDDEHELFLHYWCHGAPENLRAKWRENVSELLDAPNANEKMQAASPPAQPDTPQGNDAPAPRAPSPVAVLRDLLNIAYASGWGVSGEGYNSEYPRRHFSEHRWNEARDRVIDDLLARIEPPKDPT